MTSHFFICDVAPQRAEARRESHEIANGMKPLSVMAFEAIAHNRDVMARQEQNMGQSIQRETFMREKIASELLTVGA